MATITMYLKYQNDDLYYSMDNTNFSPLEEDTVTGVDTGDTVVWRLASNSNILKINNINVNETKGGRKSTDIWETKPKSNDGGQSFQGLIESGLDNTPKYNGYTIKYKTADGDKEKDPELKQPDGA
ncbi:hypothetical protein [Fulvivirga lutea]|uniref:Uncharacterized protein n=1 Tax=Fulvivirga lutea TaxID=2810512 RepID=A0A975A2U8_9BACT|nr:hypothetical protein [Fulvivirga lutea]QSE99221.1 hypothetical protein JR347_09075 [Fulvivirga lutea]